MDARSDDLSGDDCLHTEVPRNHVTIDRMDLEQPPAVGDCIAGRFHVEEVLGRGGMGTVFRVRDDRSGKKLGSEGGPCDHFS